MYTAEETYACFFKALQTFVKRSGYGSQTSLSIDVGITEGYMSQIMTRKRQAPFSMQVALAAAAGYSYVDFLLSGRRFLSSKDPGLDFVVKDDINHIMQTIHPYFRELQKIKEIFASGEKPAIDALTATVSGLHRGLEARHKKKQTG